MERRQVEFHPEAVAEAREAERWYRERSDFAADAFLSALDRAVERIAEAPELSARYVAGTRRFLLRHFPYSVVYREKAGRIEIIAIAHGRRRPGYWRSRLA